MRRQIASPARSVMYRTSGFGAYRRKQWSAIALHKADCRAREHVKGDGSRNGVARKTEEIGLPSLCEYYRFAGPDDDFIEINFRAYFKKRGFYKIIITHRYAAGSDNYVPAVGGQKQCFTRCFGSVLDSGKPIDNRARPFPVGCNRIAIRIAYLRAGGFHRHIDEFRAG